VKKAFLRVIVGVLLIAVCHGSSCDSDSNPPPPPDSVSITIGELIDCTGPGSPAGIAFHYALRDVMRYYREERGIPSRKLKSIAYDTKYDHTRELPGYEWCREHGASLVVSAFLGDVELLKPYAARDKVAIATMGTTAAQLEPPGWIFAFSVPTDAGMKTLMKWISDQHRDYSQGIPKIGTAGWSEPSYQEMEQATRQYCQAHSDEFDYVGGFSAPVGTTTWESEVDALKEADYVGLMAPAAASFIQEFQGSGYTATFIGLSSLTRFQGFVTDMCGWEALDGTLSAQGTLWWNESVPIVDLAKKLLQEYRPDEAEETVQAGSGYVDAIQRMMAVLEVLEQAIEEEGMADFDGQAFYDAATKYATTSPIWQGYPEWAFTETKHFLMDHLVIYEFSAEAQDLVRVSDWLPLATD